MWISQLTQLYIVTACSFIGASFTQAPDSQSLRRTPTWFGRSVLRVADVDGDGREDIVTNVMMTDLAGIVCIYSSSTRKIVADIDLGKPDSGFGYEVAKMDLPSKESKLCLVIASPYLKNENSRGQIHTVVGPPWRETFRFIAPSGCEEFGNDLAVTSDINSDGFPEVLATALVGREWRTQYTRVYCVDMRTSSVLYCVDGAPREGSSGESPLSLVGDLDGDSIEDFAIERNFILKVYSGKDGHILSTVGSDESKQGALFGNCALGIWSLDGDKSPDLIIGCPPDPKFAPHGSVALCSGRTGSVIRRLSVKDTSQSFFGHYVLLGDDLDQDGIRDLIVTTYNAFLQERFDAISIKSGKFIWSSQSPNLGDPPLQGSRIVLISDVDGDGIKDVLSTNWTVKVPDGTRHQLKLLSGRTGKTLAEIPRPTFNGHMK